MKKLNPDLVLQSWKKLIFTGFSTEGEKISEWKKYALEILEKLEFGNVGLIADTGTGKTVITLLALKALNLKTLFLAPTVILVNQHAGLYKKITGKAANTITGGQRKRDWQTNQLVIATPHVFQVEEKNGLVNADSFDILVVDELHKAQGDYPYVAIINAFKQKDKKIIALSASPGSNHDKIEKMESLYGIENWITAEITMPTKNHRLIKCPISKTMQIADQILRSMAFANLQQINLLFNLLPGEKIVFFSLEEPFLTQQANNQLHQAIEGLSKYKIYRGRSLFAKHYKISHLFRLIMTESYFSFLEYAEKSLARDHSQAADSLLKDLKWRELYWLIKKLVEDHPKENALLSLVREMNWKKKRMLIFINNKNTATYLSAKLNYLGYRSDTLFGGKNKSAKKQLATINSFLNRQLDIIIATSVVEEGLSLPEVDVVIHYSQPMTEISRLQRDGRTGRFYEGLVCFILTDIPYENSLYFATLSRLKKMRLTFYEKARKEEAKSKLAKKVAKQEAKNQTSKQLNLNFPEDLPF